MSENDLLARIDERVGTLTQDVADLKRVIMGHHGLLQDHEKLKNSHENCLYKNKETEKNRKWLIGIAVSIIGLAFAVFYKL